MGEVGDESSSPATDRLARMEAELAALSRGVQLLVVDERVAPAQERRSIPVRAAVGTYRLSAKAAAVVGFLAFLAELLGPADGPFRAIFVALFTREPQVAPAHNAAPQVIRAPDADSPIMPRVP